MAEARRDSVGGDIDGAPPAPTTYVSGMSPGLLSVASPQAAPGGRVPDLDEGTALDGGRFSILRKLGEGGMGTVYAARDRERQAEVALKTFLWSDPGSVARMKDEFRAIAEVVHRNLVGLHELFFDGQQCFFTMDLVRGRSFASWAGVEATEDDDDGPPSTIVAPARGPARPYRPGPAPRAPAFDEALLRLGLLQLVAGVDAIHRAGKLHRDLKPANVLVTARDEVVILDFGLVRDVVPGALVASEHGICGTPHYMAPEQAAGHQAGPASDWYAVGVMLYEVLTGKLPFRGSAQSVMTAKIAYTPPSPATLVEGLPADLADLCNRLLSLDPHDRPGADTIRALLGHEPSLARPRETRPTLIGRDAALADLQAAVRIVRSERRPAWVQLTGRSGYGKTALLESFKADLTSGAHATLVLMGRCYERESVPYKALDTIVDSLARHLATLPAQTRAQLIPADAPDLAQLFPALQRITAADPPSIEPRLGDAREIRRRAAHALGELLESLGQRSPVVVIIDDLQWGDVDSAWLIADLLRGSARRSPCVLLVTSSRSDEAQDSAALHLLRQRQAGLAAQVDIRQIAVDGLSDVEAHELATSLLCEGGAVARGQVDVVCREAAGSPLLLRELAEHALELEAHGQTLARETKLSLADVVRARLDKLDPAARSLFEVVCVSGRPIGQRIACLAAGVADSDGDAVVRLLRAARVMRSRTSHSAAALDVSHDRIREAALGGLDEARVRRCHQALADAYAEAGSTNPEPLAFHFAGAGDRSKGARFAEAAGEIAEKALAFDRAAQMFRMSLDLDPGTPERSRRLTARLARVLSDARRGSEAAPLFLTAADGAPVAEALALKVRAAEQWLVSGRTHEGMTAYREVLRAVGIALPETPRAALLDLLITRARLKLRAGGLGFTARREDEVPPQELLRLDACKGSWPLGFVDTIQGAALQAKYLWLALRTREPYRIALGLAMEAIYRSAEGRGGHAQAAQLQQAVGALVTALDNPHAHAFQLFAEGHVSYLQGRWLDASAACEQAEPMLVERCRNVTWELNSIRYFWANALAYQGRWRELAARLDDWLRDAEERGDLYAWSGLGLIRTVSVTLAAGDTQVARREVATALDRWGSKKFGVQTFLATVSLVQLDLYDGEPAAALARLDEMWPAFSRSLMTRIHVCRVAAYQEDAYAALALAAATSGDHRRALARALASARRLRREGMPWSNAYAEYVGAAAAHLRGDDGEAARRLATAVSAFEGAQMHLFASAARRRLGQLVAGADGEAHVAAADLTFRRQGVSHPERLSAMMAPGFRIV